MTQQVQFHQHNRNNKMKYLRPVTYKIIQRKYYFFYTKSIFVTYCQFLHLERQGLSLGQQAGRGEKKSCIYENYLYKLMNSRLKKKQQKNNELMSFKNESAKNAWTRHGENSLKTETTQLRRRRTLDCYQLFAIIQCQIIGEKCEAN